MGREEANVAGTTNSKPRESSKYGKTFRKSVLGGNTLVLFMTPSMKDEVAPITVSRENLDNPLECVPSPFTLFNMLKEVNRYMVKGAKLYESLKELRLCGWVSPYTLLLSGPAEDMKVIKKAWIKRYLKNPLGYFIKDVGIIQEFVVELLPQSPFLSLKTALFDAISDLNNQKIFPTKDNLREYLKKHYPELKLPEMKHVHDCLSRLIRERRLYHNGQGYFVICNDNVLNEVTLFSTPPECSSCYQTSASESTQIEGFVVSSSEKTSSSPGVTECDANSCAPNISNAEASSAESGFPSCLETKRIDTTNTNNPLKNFFKKHTKGGKKDDQNEQVSKKKLPDKSATAIDMLKKIEKPETKSENFHNPSVLTTNQEHVKNSPSITKTEKELIKVHMAECENETSTKKSDTSKLANEKVDKAHGRRCERNEKLLLRGKDNENVEIINLSNFTKSRLNGAENIAKRHSKCAGGHLIPMKGEGSSPASGCSPKPKSNLKRCLSLESMDRAQREVTFAVVGMPCTSSTDKKRERGQVKRSHSFGVGCRKNLYKQRNLINCNVNRDSGEVISDIGTNVKSLLLDANDNPQLVNDGMKINNNKMNKDTCTSNSLHSVSDFEKQTPDLIFNYDSLGSSLSFHKNNLTDYTVLDLSSPAKSSSLAGELRNEINKLGTVIDSPGTVADESGAVNVQHRDQIELENILLSPRSRKNIDHNPYESEYAFERLLDGGTVTKNDIPNVGEQTVTQKDVGEQTVTQKDEPETQKSNISHNVERRKQKQKNRNSLLFEEKRNSLKVMGLV